jgi:hypothetical protein
MPPFLNQQLFLEILSDLACPFRKFYWGEFPCRELQKIPEAEANVAVHTQSGPQLLQVGGNRQLDGEIWMSTHLRLVRSRTRPYAGRGNQLSSHRAKFKWGR